VKITEVRIKLIKDGEERLKAFCSVTLDAEFVVRDLKIISGPNGLFVAMPSRRLTVRCYKCSCRIDLRARFCSSCGKRQQPPSANGGGGEATGRQFADIAHPINGSCRTQLETAVLSAYAAETDRSSRPGYTDRYDERDHKGPEI
jgi:stage V sporulation protein G